MTRSWQDWRPKKLWPSRGAVKTPPVRLDGPRVYLRPAILSDYPQWADVRGRNESRLKPFEPAWPENCLSPDMFRRRVERLAREWDADATYAFLIFDRNNDALIGGLNINGVSRGAAQMASLGYWIDESHEGQGMMPESIRLVLGFAFGPLSLARMNAATLAHNDRSRNMLLRLGFTEEGFAKAYIQIEGRRQDHVLYGLNAQSWRVAIEV